MKIKMLRICCGALCFAFSAISEATASTGSIPTDSIDWEKFLAQHDMQWDTLTADPVEPHSDRGQKTGYYAGAIMGNGLLGTNLYKLKDNVYRLNVGRSDVTEARQPYDLYNSARLPIGYFTLSTVGHVTEEEMRLSLYDAATSGHFSTDRGRIDFRTYVHSLHNYIVFETACQGEEADFQWNFVPQKAISPRYVIKGMPPTGYLNHQGNSNPEAFYLRDGDRQYMVQPLVTDSSMTEVARVYVVGWKEIRRLSHRRIVATVAQEDSQEAALKTARLALDAAAATDSAALYRSHRKWWNDFYRHAAFLSFPDTRFESFYWAQYYKFASTARPGKPIVDLQGVWPTWDTPWTAVWINLNLQLTYSWLAKANLGALAEPLWNSLYRHREQLRKNVTDIPGQESWTDAACLGRTSSYDFHSPLDPQLAEKNQYEVGNLTWLLFYYWQYCKAYGDDRQMTERLFPMLKSAINLYFHIRTLKDGKYGLPPTASPEYADNNVGANTNYDLASLRWGLQTLIELNYEYRLEDPMLPRWKDFLDHLVDYPYDETTGFMVSETHPFEHVNHRHYSHLFMIYPYYLVNWGQKEHRNKIRLSVERWKGNMGYSRTGKAAMLLSMGDGEGAMEQMNKFLDHFVKPNTLYAETGPVIETPLAAISTLHDFYLQDWGGTMRIFHGIPSAWKEASFAHMRAQGAFLLSARRKGGKTVYLRIESERGNRCRLQTDIPLEHLQVHTAYGKRKIFQVVDTEEGIIEMQTSPGELIEITDSTQIAEKPTALPHPLQETRIYGQRK